MRKAVVLLGLFGVAALLALTPAVNAAHVTPQFIPGNPTCAGGLKIEPVESGTYGPVTITVTGKSFSFESTVPVTSVLVKGGPGANLYVYDPAVLSDTGLVAPTGANGKQAGLSHLCFFFDDKK